MFIQGLFFSRIARLLEMGRASVWLAVCGVLCATALCAAQLRICGRCGVEALDAEAACRECAAALPAMVAGQAVDAPAVALNPGATRPVMEDLIRTVGEDVRTARELEQANPAAAMEYYRHAIGLVRVAPPDLVPQDVRDNLVAGMGRCRQAISRTTRVCNTCNGTGRRTLPTRQPAATGPRGLSTGATAFTQDCPRCNAVGQIVAPRTMEELRVTIGQGRALFEQQMRALGRVSCGRAFLPAGMEEQLTLQERALIRGALADGCADCLSLGKVDCTTCKGFGNVPCRGRGCQNGRVAGVGDAQATNCTTCHGAGELSCVACQGKGTLSCRTCKGSGQGVRCRGCGGEGIAQCGTCRGKGGDCKVCNGETRVLCAQCFGEGVRGR